MLGEPPIRSRVSPLAAVLKTTCLTKFCVGEFIVVGEAWTALRHIDTTIAISIPDLARIIAFRNLLIHGYAGVDDRLVWGVIERDLDVLRTSLARLLDTEA